MWFGLGFFCFDLGFFSEHIPRLLLVKIKGSVSKRSRDSAKVLINWILVLLAAATLYYLHSHSKILRNRNDITDRWNSFCLRTDAFYTTSV